MVTTACDTPSQHTEGRSCRDGSAAGARLAKQMPAVRNHPHPLAQRPPTDHGRGPLTVTSDIDEYAHALRDASAPARGCDRSSCLVEVWDGGPLGPASAATAPAWLD